MAIPTVSRPTDEQSVTDFLTAVTSAPAALVIEGDPGIGKTTLWLDGLERARERGFTILASRAARAESVLAYAALADLLRDVDQSVWADLPAAQRQSLDAALLRQREHAGPSDARAAAAAFVGVLDRLATRSEGFVLLAVDDVQWIDVSSASVVAFAARRLPRGVGLMFATRSAEVAARVELARPDAVHRIRLQPLTVGALHRIMTLRLGISVPRPTLMRIHQIAGGNPFYGLELARTLDGHTGDLRLPESLSGLVSSRIRRMSPEAQEVLLAAASVPSPTLHLLAQATGRSSDSVLDVLAEAETHGVIAIDGNRVSFTHPILAHGVYSEASPQRRRATHRRMAEIVDEPELKARHLALSDPAGNRETIDAIDSAAEIAHNRGAPAAAGELLHLAINLGADDPARRILCATHYFAAGDTGRARRLLEAVVDELASGPLRAEAICQLALLRLHDDGFVDAAELLEKGIPERGVDDILRVRMLILLAYALFNAGQHGQALDRVRQSVTEAEELAVTSLLSAALSMRETLGFLAGHGFDAAAVLRAVELEGETASVPMPVAFYASVQMALLRGWTGEFEHAREVLAAKGQRCVASGQESELIFIAFSQALMDIWRGDLPSVALTGDETVERAAQLGGDFPMFIALTIRGAAAAYAGRADEAARDLDDAIAAARRCGSMRMSEWPVTLRGFVENSRGDHQAALNSLEPLLAMARALPDATEIIAASYLPEAVEALIGVGRLDEAEPLIDNFERNGRRLDRAWMLATALRCRAMLLAARGDVTLATSTAELAMAEHRRLPMPFEQARTQLLLGQLQRRQRRRQGGGATLREALQTFEQLGTALWAERTKAELARGTSGRQRSDGLTPSERRVAELAVSGMTNRDIAASLFISPKTVEVNLSRIYRKLEVRSRIELLHAWPAGERSQQ